jgi:hypothetical protein
MVKYTRSKTSKIPKEKISIQSVNTTIRKIKKKEKEEIKPKGDLDENGNPFPTDNPEGGDPVCPDGYKSDDDFDVNDPLDPPFRCKSALKEPSDGPAQKIMTKLNNPSSNITDLITNAHAAGGSQKRRRRHRERHRRPRSQPYAKQSHRKFTQRRKK